MKQMTESAAWRYLGHRYARAAAGPVPDRAGATVYIQVGDALLRGLCASVEELRDLGKISDEVEASMTAALRALLRENDYFWLAPTNREGAAYRALLCAFLATVPEAFTPNQEAVA